MPLLKLSRLALFFKKKNSDLKIFPQKARVVRKEKKVASKTQESTA